MHDQHFKELLRRFFGDFVRIVLPDMAPRLRLERPRFLDKELFTDVKGGKHRRLDLLAEVDTTGGERELLLVHVEVEARARGRRMDERMWRYAMQLWLRENELVIPVVLDLRGGPSGVERITVDKSFAGQRLASFTYWVFGLARSDAKKYFDRPELLAPALAALMDRGELSAAEHRLECRRRIFRAEVDDAGRFLLMDTVEMYIELDEGGEEEYERLLAAEENEEVKIMEMTWSQSLRAEGRQEGLQEGLEQGLEQGRLDGMRGLVRELLERRFGPLPAESRERLMAISSPEELSRLHELALEVGGLDELDL